LHSDPGVNSIKIGAEFLINPEFQDERGGLAFADITLFLKIDQDQKL
jgi:hypothetical protein